MGLEGKNEINSVKNFGSSSNLLSPSVVREGQFEGDEVLKVERDGSSCRQLLKGTDNETQVNLIENDDNNNL